MKIKVREEDDPKNDNINYMIAPSIKGMSKNIDRRKTSFTSKQFSKKKSIIVLRKSGESHKKRRHKGEDQELCI